MTLPLGKQLRDVHCKVSASAGRGICQLVRLDAGVGFTCMPGPLKSSDRRTLELGQHICYLRFTVGQKCGHSFPEASASGLPTKLQSMCQPGMGVH